LTPDKLSAVVANGLDICQHPYLRAVWLLNDDLCVPDRPAGAKCLSHRTPIMRQWRTIRPMQSAEAAKALIPMAADWLATPQRGRRPIVPDNHSVPVADINRYRKKIENHIIDR
jgi:hypothetical protein